MKPQFYEVQVCFPRQLEPLLEGLLAMSDVLGCEQVDAATWEEYCAQAKEWELAEKSEIVERWKAQVDEAWNPQAVYWRVYFAKDADGAAACQTFVAACREKDGVQVRIHTVENEDWATGWRTYYHPVEVGERFLILPAWEEAPETSRLLLRVEPGMAFGTGTHETTQLMLQALESVPIQGRRGLDLGCGSGILAIAMKKCGARSCDALDIDEEALQTCRTNLALNGVSVRVATSDLWAQAQGVYDLICANLLTPLILRILEGVADFLAPQGDLILSGILARDADLVRDALTRRGLRADSTRTLGEWALLHARWKEAQ